eukprot:1590259-Pyramimonas_sp.AAC.1
MSRAILQFCGQGEGPTGSSQGSRWCDLTITKLQLNWPVGPPRPGQICLHTLDRPRETIGGQE